MWNKNSLLNALISTDVLKVDPNYDRMCTNNILSQAVEERNNYYQALLECILHCLVSTERLFPILVCPCLKLDTLYILFPIRTELTTFYALPTFSNDIIMLNLRSSISK